jgi:hypothetical protein
MFKTMDRRIAEAMLQNLGNSSIPQAIYQQICEENAQTKKMKKRKTPAQKFS